MSDRFILKQGEGSADNSSRWKVCYDIQERLIREGGRMLYISMFDRNMPGLDEVIDRNYRELCPWAEIISFDGQ